MKAPGLRRIRLAPAVGLDPRAGTALQSSVTVEAVPGVYRKVSTRGTIYWDLQAFNVTTAVRTQHARLTLVFTDDLKLKDSHNNIAGQRPVVQPFTKRDVCATWTVPSNTQVIFV